MPRKRKSQPQSKSDIKKARQLSRWVWVLGCVMLGLYLVIAMADYTPGQSAFFDTNPSEKNIAGRLGVFLSEYALLGLGFAGWLAPLLLLWMAWLFAKRDNRSKGVLAGAMVAALVTFASLLSIQDTFFTENKERYPFGPGGGVGNVGYHVLMEDLLGNIGSALILLVLLVASCLYIFTPNLTATFEGFKAKYQAWQERRAAAKEARLAAKQTARDAKEQVKASKEEARKQKHEAKQLLKEAKALRKKSKLTPEIDPVPEPEPTETKEEGKPSIANALTFIAPEETKKARAKLPEVQGDYVFPKLELLEEQDAPMRSNTEQEHAENAERLMNTLKEFGVEVTLGEIHIGPVITRYEVYPAPGVRVEKISNLDKNIALGMRAQSVRILAPVPGKGCVGIEVPNSDPLSVGLREILESEDWVKSKAEIPIALGRDVSGKPIISDLTRMPHLLIAGATGSGKTVCINSVIASLLYHSSPENLRFLMVDPKIVEMKIFNDLPHMLIPVVTDPKKVPGALKWLLNEMEHRYEIFAKCGVRNISGFNTRKKPEEKKPEPDNGQEELEISVPRDEGVLDEIPDKLPYIVCIIDELADLMMVAPADVETGIARLAQLARAAGIHLIIATQRPSVNVITGVIKANLPCRISFQVSSKIDSRTILDGPGAEQLIGRGDMLFSPPGTSKLIRSQGAFISDEDIHNVVNFLKTNGPPKFAEEVQKQIEQPDELELGGGEDGDEMLPQAIEVLRSSKRASTSMLQRRLRIGYNRAARIMEILEDRGIVGPENGSSPREILVDLDSM